MALPKLSELPRYPLSIVLSCLQQPLTSPSPDDSGDLEDDGLAHGAPSPSPRQPPFPHNRDALSLLLTNRRFSRDIMPLFRVPRNACRNWMCQSMNGTLVTVPEKYRFAVLPIQDPRTLLDRLNTRRLKGRLKLMAPLLSNKTSTNSSLKSNGPDTNRNEKSGRCKSHDICYQLGRSIEELAFEEWMVMRIHHGRNINEKTWITWPAHLELLVFAETLEEHKYRNGCERRRGFAGDVSGLELSRKQSNGRRAKGQGRFLSLSPIFSRATRNAEMSEAVPECVALTGADPLRGDGPFGEGVTLLASYPRSGNSLLRNLIERVTSVATGSDTRPDRTLSRSLAVDHGLVGEGLVSDLANDRCTSDPTTVRVVKTHFPERMGWRPVEGRRVLLLIRNPYDAIDSYWNLCCTNTHTRTLDDSVYQRYARKFDDMAHHEITTWSKFHYHWIDECERRGVPLLIVHYENLLLKTEAEMLRIVSFLAGRNDDTASKCGLSSFWKWRVQHAVRRPTKQTGLNASENTRNLRDTSDLGSYRPRSSDGGMLSIGKSIRKGRYSKTILKNMHEAAASLESARTGNLNNIRNPLANTNSATLLQRFGYDVFEQQFPEKFIPRPAPTLLSNGRGGGTVVINRGREIRNKDDEFGRAMTFWRRGETEGDTRPFLTVSR